MIDLEGIILSEISQTKKDKYIRFYLWWNLKNKTNEQTKPNRNRLINRENTPVIAGVEEEGNGWLK